MKIWILGLLIFYFVISNTYAGFKSGGSRSSGGSSSSGGSRGSSGRWGSSGSSSSKGSGSLWGSGSSSSKGSGSLWGSGSSSSIGSGSLWGSGSSSSKGSGSLWGSGSSSSKGSGSIWNSSPSSKGGSSPSTNAKASSTFLNNERESSRPATAAPAPRTPAPPPRVSSTNVGSSPVAPKPNAPPYSPPSNSGSNAGNIRPVQTATQANPYSRQPASNPYLSQPSNPWVRPSGGYNSPGSGSGSQFPSAPSGVGVPKGTPGSPPYPVNQPNHPHPQQSSGVSQQPSQTWQARGTPPPYSAHPQQPGHGFGPVGPPPSYYSGSAYNPREAPPAYYPPPHYSFPPPNQPITPGKTVYVIDSGKGGGSRGSGIKDAIAQGVASGTAHAVTNQVIKGLFHSGSNRVHSYPTAPQYESSYGHSSSSHTYITNNYYGSDNNEYVGQPQPASNQPSQPSQPSQPGQPNQTPNRPPSATNGGPPQPGQAASPNPATSIQPAQGTPNNQPNNAGNPPSATNGAVSATSNAQPDPAPSNTPLISDENLTKITEELFEKQDEDLNQYIELNLQKRVITNSNSSAPVTDEAPEPLFKIHPDLDKFPTVRTLKALYDNHQRNGSQKENVTEPRGYEENAFIDEIIKTPVMSRAFSWLMEQKFVGWDESEHKALLKVMWFSIFDDTSSGFERIFLSERFGDSGLVGLQNWIYFAHLESQQNLNYLGYVDMKTLEGKGALVKLNYQTEGFTMQNATIFAGTPPELELALYTICFYARPNDWCPVSLGGVKFFILTHSFAYYDRILIDLGFPAF